MAITYVTISEVTVGSGGAANITFSNIPQTYTDLQIFLSARNTNGGTFDAFDIAFNETNWTGNREFYRYLTSLGAGTTAGETSGNGPSTTANTFGNAVIYIPNYTSANSKTFISDETLEDNSVNSYTVFHTGNSGITAAITSITITGGNLAQHTTATLYGIKNTV